VKCPYRSIFMSSLLYLLYILLNSFMNASVLHFYINEILIIFEFISLLCQNHEIFPLKDAVTGPDPVINGVSLHRATPSSPAWRKSAILVYSLVALLPASTGAEACPGNFISSPTELPAGGFIGSTFVWLSLLMHMIIPLDIMPLKFLGFKLHSTMTILFSNCSSVTYCASPETIVRGPVCSPILTQTTTESNYA
jgi:hypothetical protein